MTELARRKSSQVFLVCCCCGPGVFVAVVFVFGCFFRGGGLVVCFVALSVTFTHFNIVGEFLMILVILTFVFVCCGQIRSKCRCPS